MLVSFLDLVSLALSGKEIALAARRHMLVCTSNYSEEVPHCSKDITVQIAFGFGVFGLGVFCNFCNGTADFDNPPCCKAANVYASPTCWCAS